MARYELRGPDGKRYEVNAPDSMGQDAVLERFRREVTTIPQEPDFTPEEREVADAPMDTRERSQRLMSSYVPGSERIRAATLATIPGLMNERINQGGWGDRYDKALRIMRHRDDRAQREGRGVGDLAARTTGATLSVVGTGAGNLTYRALTPILEAGARLPQIARESARIGAGIGAPTALLNTRSETPGGQVADVLQGTVGGAVVGAALPFGFAGLGKLHNMTRIPFQGGSGQRSAPQQSFVRDWDELVGTQPPGAVVAESPTLQTAGRRLSRSILGGPVREDVRRGADDLEQSIQTRIRSGLPDETEFAGDQQTFLRQQLRGYSRPHEEVDAMDRTALGEVANSRRDTYPTNYSARYRLAETNQVDDLTTAADVRGNFVDRQPVSRPLSPRAAAEPPRNAVEQPTSTWTLLNAFGRQARQRGALPGWRNGDFSDDFWKHMEGRVGPQLAQALRGEAGRRAASQANLTIPGLRGQRTEVGRAIDAIENHPYGAPDQPPGNIADLRRLWGSMSDDLQRFMRESGPGGPQAGRAFQEVDASYGADFIRGLRQPLQRIVGGGVNPDEGLRRLMRATQNNTYDANMLRAWRTVLAEKGDSTRAETATRVLLTPMLEDGLPGFLRAWNNLHPGARRIMATGNDELFRDLDKFARLAQRFAPYQRSMEEAPNIATAGNLGWGVWAFSHLPSAIVAAGGVHALARFMSSPRYLRWLTQAPLYTRGGMNSKAFRDHVNRLHVIAGGDPEIGQAVLQALGSVQPVGAAIDPRRERLQDMPPVIPDSMPSPDDATMDEIAPQGEPDVPPIYDTEQYATRPRKSATQRAVEVSRFTNKSALERFLEPARGIAGTIQRTVDDTPGAFDRLTNYRTGQNDPQAPVDALALSGLASVSGIGAGAQRGALAAGVQRRGGRHNPALDDVDAIVARLEAGESQLSIARDIGASQTGLRMAVVNRRPDVDLHALDARRKRPSESAEPVAKEPKERIGSFERQVRFREAMERGYSVDETVRYTMLPKREVERLISEKYGNRAIVDDRAAPPQRQPSRPTSARGEPPIQRLMRAGKDHKQIARELRISPEAALREMQAVRRMQLFMRGLKLPAEPPRDFWDHDNEGAFITGQFGRYWGDDRLEQSYDEGIVGDREQLPNPEGGRMRFVDPNELFRRRARGRDAVDTHGRFGLHLEERDGDPGRFASAWMRNRGGRSRKAQDRLKRER